jgi:hypothetical protein
MVCIAQTPTYTVPGIWPQNGLHCSNFHLHHFWKQIKMVCIAQVSTFTVPGIWPQMACIAQDSTFIIAENSLYLPWIFHITAVCVRRPPTFLLTLSTLPRTTCCQERMRWVMWMSLMYSRNKPADQSFAFWERAVYLFDAEVKALTNNLIAWWNTHTCTQVHEHAHHTHTHMNIYEHTHTRHTHAHTKALNKLMHRKLSTLHCTPQVQDVLFSASYLVLGLGDVYLGAPCAVPLDPRHRLVTTKCVHFSFVRMYAARGMMGRRHKCFTLHLCGCVLLMCEGSVSNSEFFLHLCGCELLACVWGSALTQVNSHCISWCMSS